LRLAPTERMHLSSSASSRLVASTSTCWPGANDRQQFFFVVHCWQSLLRYSWR
jgi:hypothetical protein